MKTILPLALLGFSISLLIIFFIYVVVFGDRKLSKEDEKNTEEAMEYLGW